MNDIRPKINHGQNAEHRFAEKGKPLSVVIMSVAIGAFEIIFVIYKIIGNAVCLGLEHTAVLISPGQRDIGIAQISELLHVLFRNLLVQRHNHPYL